MIHQKFYTELGKLLYAISNADGCSQKHEKKIIENLIHGEIWHHQSYFDKHPEWKEIILTKLSFFNAEKEKLSTQQAFNSYKVFFKKYGKKLDDHQKELASSLVSRVAAAFRGIDK